MQIILELKREKPPVGQQRQCDMHVSMARAYPQTRVSLYVMISGDLGGLGRKAA